MAQPERTNVLETPLRNALKIRRFLIAIVVLLFLPLLMFAGLWLKQSLRTLDAMDENLAALNAVQNLYPSLQHVVLGVPAGPLAPQLDSSGRLPLSPGQQKRATDLYLSLLEDENPHKTLSTIKELTQLLFSAVEVSSVLHADFSAHVAWSRGPLLSVLQEAIDVWSLASQLSEKPLLDVEDKLALSVAAGKFKLAADSIDEFALDLISSPPALEDTGLESLALAYLSANRKAQASGKKLLSLAMEGGIGPDLQMELLRSDFDGLKHNVLFLWHGSLRHATRDLTITRSTAQRTLGVASLSGGLVILFALALVAIYSRQLVVKTDATLSELRIRDSLTGLGTRQSLVHDRLSSETKEDTWSGLLHLDLRRFRAINTRYGEDIGDQVLQIVAALLRGMIPENAQVARSGGAEFVVLLSRIHHPRELEELADRITVALAAERVIRGHAIRLDCCIGLSLLKAGSGDLERLLTDASLALRAAKSKGSFGICLYAPHMRQSFVRNSEIAKDLQEAMSRGQIVPWYQPQICTRTGRIVGVEALVRWIDENGAPRSPASFLPAAEEAGYMNRLDTVIRARALSEIARIPVCREGSFHIGLNITAGILAEPDCVTQLLDATSQAGLSPSQVSIEILEAVMLDRPDATPILKNVTDLSRLGFHMELDDFGTGHASIASLRDLKIDRVKIDRSFVAGVHANQELQTFTRALIQLARSLGIEVLAEGVEMEEERRWLTANGCAVLQGYLFARAMPFDDLRALMERQPFRLETVPPPGRQTTAQAC